MSVVGAMTMGISLPSSRHNPILSSENLADPHMIMHEGKYYLYGTYLDGSIGGGSDHYDVFISEDMKNWQKGPVVFKKNSTTLWAPDVFRDPASGKFYLYYSNEMSIGVAVADSPTGPFMDLGVLVPEAIDAHMFYDQGSYYLYYASIEIDNEYELFLRFLLGLLSGSRDKAAERILVQKMSSPTQVDGEPVLLLEPTVAWEKGVIVDINEGPWMYKANGTYYLMYSGNETMFGKYAIGYATSNDPMGPFTKYAGNPIVQTRAATAHERGVYSPGHHSVVRDTGGRDWLIYHQKKGPRHIGFSQRYTCRDELILNESGELVVRSTPMRDF